LFRRSPPYDGLPSPSFPAGSHLDDRPLPLGHIPEEPVLAPAGTDRGRLGIRPHQAALALAKRRLPAPRLASSAGGARRRAAGRPTRSRGAARRVRMKRARAFRPLTTSKQGRARFASRIQRKKAPAARACAKLRGPSTAENGWSYRRTACSPYPGDSCLRCAVTSLDSDRAFLLRTFHSSSFATAGKFHHLAPPPA
jgi:hypothetical protein